MTTPISTPAVINDVIPRTQATAIAGQVTFNTNWTANAASDVLVYRRTSAQEADDQTQLVSQSDYTVEFVGTYQTVRITFLVACTAGDIVTISRDTPADRTNLYTNTNFVPSMLNEDFGILTLVDQQAQLYDQDLAPHYNISCSFTDTSDLAIDNILPILDANEFWVKNPSNTAITKAVLDSGSLPAAGPFVTYTADDALVGAFDLGLLSAGILAQTVTDAVATPYVLSIPLNVSNGGTGATSFTPRGVMLAGTSSTSALRTVASLGTAGQVLTSNGAGADPTFQNTATVGSINVIKVTANGTYTPSAGLKFCQIECMGGGGGGAGSDTAPPSGVLISSGGGAGGYSRITVSAATIGASQAVTVGTAGAGGSAGPNAGGNGTATSVGVICVANGGSGGPTSISGGLGATAGTGDIAGTGMCGLPGVATSLNTTTFAGGGGGSTQWGQGGQATGGNSAGIAATGYGAGGGGAATSNGGGAQAGGAGAPGYVVITEYLSA